MCQFAEDSSSSPVYTLYNKRHLTTCQSPGSNICDLSNLVATPKIFYNKCFYICAEELNDIIFAKRQGLLLYIPITGKGLFKYTKW